MLRGILQNELFFCNHLGTSENDFDDIHNFKVIRGPGLLNYIQYYAIPDEDDGVMRTYVVRDNVSYEMVGYFSLKAGLISYDEEDVPLLDEETGEAVIDEETGEMKTQHFFKTMPGVELANFAVDQNYIEKHADLKGVGLVIFKRFILPIVRKTSESIGIKVLYIFALPYDDLISRYEKYGFSRLGETYEMELHSRLKPKYDGSCVFMYQLL